MELKNVREKSHRLPSHFYKGETRITFTLCVKDKENLFTNYSVVNKFIEYLDKAMKKYDCKNWAYIFMPNHTHIVLEGNSIDADLWKTIVCFKQKTGFWLLKNNLSFRWQKDFYDYIHRADGDLKKHIAYILENPVRNGLVNNWEDYPFKGSLNYKLEEIVN